MPVSAPSDRRFRRAHVTPAHRPRFLRLSARAAGRAALVLAGVAYVGYLVTRQALAARVLAALQARPDLARRVSEIDVSDERDATLILKGDTALVRVGTEQFVERLQSYVDLAPTLRERIAAIDSVDLRFDQRVYVRPAAKRGN
jgi:cell division septal protein FtsQ